MKFWERLGSIDRRIIYLVLAVLVIVPLIATVKLPSKVRAMPRTKDIFDHVEAIDPNGQRKAMILSVDFDPQVEPELKPQMEAMVRHAFARDIPLIVLAMASIQGTDIGNEIVLRLAREHNKVYGKDYVLLGWKPGLVAVVLGLGNFIEQVFPTDYFGNRLSELPMMQDITNYNDVGLVGNFTGSSSYGYWVIYGYNEFGVPVAAGVTSVSVADLYPYLGSKQLIGMLAGMKGAAEYERLVKDRYYPNIDIELLGPNAFKVTVDEQTYDADDDDVTNLAHRFKLNEANLRQILEKENRFEKALPLLEFLDATPYTRQLIVEDIGKRFLEVKIEKQELPVDRAEMLMLADFYSVSASIIDTILRVEVQGLLKEVLGAKLQIQTADVTDLVIEEKVSEIMDKEFSIIFHQTPLLDTIADTLILEPSSEEKARQNLEQALKEVIRVSYPEAEISDSLAREVLSTELNDILKVKSKGRKRETEVSVERDIFLRGTQALPALSAALIVIIVFVIIGNVSFFVTRRRKK
ncbi:hypothetical protein JXM67_11330 [candidate division WOR-3 bacterium]|nr:hypothetical protein [candidate division WOR-3 bacterium]